MALSCKRGNGCCVRELVPKRFRFCAVFVFVFVFWSKSEVLPTILQKEQRDEPTFPNLKAFYLGIKHCLKVCIEILGV